MRKVLPGHTPKKRSKGKRAEILSGIVILCTVASLLLVTGLSYIHNAETEKASGFAIYKGDTARDEAAMMFNVYEGNESIYAILEILRKNSSKATFFIGGIWAEKHPEVLLDIVRNGHELGCHGYLHKDHSKMSVEQNKEEIAICSELVKKITGVTIRLFAPPSGAFNENTEIACKALGQKMILWTKDTIDWRDRDVDLLVKRATKNISRGDLILMHPKTQTVAALPRIIEAYQNEGFSLLSVSEVIG